MKFKCYDNLLETFVNFFYSQNPFFKEKRESLFVINDTLQVINLKIVFLPTVMISKSIIEAYQVSHIVIFPVEHKLGILKSESGVFSMISVCGHGERIMG